MKKQVLQKIRTVRTETRAVLTEIRVYLEALLLKKMMPTYVLSFEIDNTPKSETEISNPCGKSLI